MDCLIIAPDRITLIDFKTGRVGHLADRYLPQMIRYRSILRGPFPGRPVECYLLFVDEPQRIVTVGSLPATHHGEPQFCAVTPVDNSTESD